jgi:hypothetical protein
LFHNDEPIGYIAVSPAALGNSVRNKIFKRTVWSGKTVNRLFCNISRVVLDPRYRGAGIAADFLRAAVLQCNTPYVEMMTSMGVASKFWEKAGFVDCGPSKFAKEHKTDKHNDVYGMMYNRSHTSTGVKAQSKLSVMHYYLADVKKLKVQ